MTLALLLTSAPLWAQFSQLSATDDGQQLFFTSPLRMNPQSPAHSENRVYRAGPDGITLFAERGSLAPAGFFGGGMGLPQTSGDGSVVAITGIEVCPSSGSCTNPSSQEGLLRGSVNADLGPGMLQISRNGRWAVLTPPRAAPAAPNDPPPPPPQTATLFDLQNNTNSQIPAPDGYPGMVASSGAVLVAATNAGPLGLWKAGQISPIVISGLFRIVALSDNASTLVYLSSSPAGQSLMARNLDFGYEVTLCPAAGLSQFPSLLSMSNDGRWVLYMTRTSQLSGAAYLADTFTGASSPVVLNAGEFTAAGALSGSGNTGYLATSLGRIVRFNISAGQPGPLTEIVGPTLYLAPNFAFNALVPGSMADFKMNLAQNEPTPTISLGGTAVPILSSSPTDIRIQVPWEQKVGEQAFTVVAGSPLFQQNDLVSVGNIGLSMAQADPAQKTLFGLLFIKGDFSGLVTSDPGPGDIIVTYMTGLGPVNGKVQTGVPTPVGTTFPVQGKLTCKFLPNQSAMTTLFAGLAPLMIGIYQVTFQLPPDAGTAPITGFSCQYQTPAGSEGFTISSIPVTQLDFVPTAGKGN